MSSIKQKLIFPSSFKMNCVIGFKHQTLKIIQANSGIEGYTVDYANRSVICNGTAESLVHAQKLMDNIIRYNEMDWKMILYKYLDSPELYPDDILFEDDSLVVVKDGFPKAKCHFFILVKDRTIAGMFLSSNLG